jgi:dephospho-CoA kinase
MSKCLKVGITGGIGSGKTTVCRIFESLGMPVYYADQMAKHIMIHDVNVKQKIKQLLSPEAYFANGRPNRPFIASKVFTDPALLQKLNEIVHPAVHDDFEMFYQKYKNETPYVINEAALLVENGSYQRFDVLIVVTCPEEIRVERILKRDKTTRDEVLRRIKNQLPEEEKVKPAHYIIDNSGKHALIPQVWNVHQALLAMD